jgi:hypothetical protein
MEQENPSSAARVRRTSAVSSALLHETFEVNFLRSFGSDPDFSQSANE